MKKLENIDYNIKKYEEYIREHNDLKKENFIIHTSNGLITNSELNRQQSNNPNVNYTNNVNNYDSGYPKDFHRYQRSNMRNYSMDRDNNILNGLSPNTNSMKSLNMRASFSPNSIQTPIIMNEWTKSQSENNIL